MWITRRHSVGREVTNARPSARGVRGGPCPAEPLGDTANGTLIEGYVDLLFRDNDTVVIVDHKSDAVPAR